MSAQAVFARLRRLDCLAAYAKMRFVTFFAPNCTETILESTTHFPYKQFIKKEKVAKRPRVRFPSGRAQRMSTYFFYYFRRVCNFFHYILEVIMQIFFSFFKNLYALTFHVLDCVLELYGYIPPSHLPLFFAWDRPWKYFFFFTRLNFARIAPKAAPAVCSTESCKINECANSKTVSVRKQV